MPGATAEENKKLNEREIREQTVVLESKPQRLVFEVTNRCNLRCRMCGQSHRKFKGVDMSPEVFRKTEDFWRTAYDASLFGWGEPLLNRHLGEFFDLLSACGPRIFVLTNGMLLTDGLIEKFVKGKLAFMNFSFDGVNAATYNEIRRGSDFDTVLSNIKKVVALKKETGSDTPYLRMVFVGMRRNIEEFPRFVEMAAELGMNEAKMVHMIAYGKAMEDEVLFHSKELTNRVLDEAEEKAAELGIKLNIPDRFHLSEGAAPELIHKPCPRPWEEMFIQGDGKVRLCMLSNDIMGDLNKDSIGDIWNNDRYRFFREKINTSDAPSTCAHCPQYKEMNVNDLSAFIQTETELPGAAGGRGK